MQCIPTDYIILVLLHTMQTTLQSRRIDDDERKNAILEMISDKYCRTILEVTMDKPKSAMKIANETKIPISTVYRRLQDLTDNRLLRISGIINDEGKKYFLYKSKVKEISTTVNGNYIELQIVPNMQKNELGTN